MGSVPRDEDISSSPSESTDPNDETWDDWLEDPMPCLSLFDNVELPSVSDALKHDLETHDFNFEQLAKRLNLDFHQRARLVNYIRSNKVTPQVALSFTCQESFFSDDTYLRPVIPDDPLLQLESDDWSDDEQDGSGTAAQTSKSLPTAPTQDQLNSARLAQLQQRVHELLDELPFLTPTSAASAVRDDDSHYFESYGYQEIHATMLRDTVRTMSYAKFILSNPEVFRDKLVMDVGCGTGILSMFAARAGAKHVFAIDASNVALKARRNIQDNELENVITVIQDKVETVKLPAPYDDPSVRVDVIISEWMGYALLYESMLDSVLIARDRFLKKSPASTSDGTAGGGGGGGGGIMAPSQCKMVFALAEAAEVWKERVAFWDDVYGFKMSSMADEAFGDALIEHLPHGAVASDLFTIKDLPLQRITQKQLAFSQPFTLTVTKEKDGSTIHAFLLYFDTYFQPDGSDVLADSLPSLHEPEGNFIPGDILPVGLLRRGKSLKEKHEKKERKLSTTSTPVSFSTGPQSLCTHWKQTVFLLRNPFKAIEGTTVTGSFHLKKSETNSRELDVEIHYAVSHTGLGPMSGTTVLMYKVR